MPPFALDIAAFTIFAIAWLFYEPILRRVKSGNHVNSDMRVLRGAWMRAMAGRDNRIMDGQLLGNALHSASFFASSNLLLIAAVAGVLFGGQGAWQQIQGLEVLAPTTRMLFELKLALVLITLARGLLDFIWAIRQLNYCLAAVGAAPEPGHPQGREWGDAAAGLLNPALSAFNTGVRGYYFALAAAAWLLGPIPFTVAVLGAVALLAWRQTRSAASSAIVKLRDMVEAREAEDAAKPPAPPRKSRAKPVG
jgi:uncharacterized membrane protein